MFVPRVRRRGARGRCSSSSSARVADGGDGAAGGGGGVDPFTHGAQDDSPIAEFGDRAGDLCDGAPEAVNGVDYDDIPLTGVVEQSRQAGAMRSGSPGQGVGEDSS